MNLVNSGDGQVGLREAEDHGDSCLDVHVVILNNYLRKHHVASYRALAKRVRKLTVLLSVPMESDRAWDADWEDLDVHVQRNWMFDADDQASIMGALGTSRDDIRLTRSATTIEHNYFEHNY